MSVDRRTVCACHGFVSAIISALKVCRDGGVRPYVAHVAHVILGQLSAAMFGQLSAAMFGQRSTAMFGQRSAAMFGQRSAAMFGQRSAAMFGVRPYVAHVLARDCLEYT